MMKRSKRTHFRIVVRNVILTGWFGLSVRRTERRQERFLLGIHLRGMIAGEPVQLDIKLTSCSIDVPLPGLCMNGSILVWSKRDRCGPIQLESLAFHIRKITHSLFYMNREEECVYLKREKPTRGIALCFTAIGFDLGVVMLSLSWWELSGKRGDLWVLWE